MGNVQVSFADLLKRHRLAVGLTQEELAGHAGMSPRGVSDLERGKRTKPQPGNLRRLAETLHLGEVDRAAFLAAAQGSASQSPSPAPVEPLSPPNAPSLPAPLPSFLLPTGTVTFLFTDIEGSTQHLRRLGASAYAQARDQHHRLLREAFAAHSGVEVDTQGDAFFVAFARASDAVLAAAAAQRALAAYPWPGGLAMRVRMGLHTGEPQRSAEGFVGLDVHQAARIMSAAHGGQALLSQTTRDLVEQTLPADMGLLDLGLYRLKDLQQPTQLFQLVLAGLPADFGPLKTLDALPNNLPLQPTPFIGREQEVAAGATLLRREEVRLVTLTGPGGAGKTRLGLQMAAEVSEAFPAGVFFVNLAPLSDPAHVLPAIAQVLEVRETGERSLFEHLTAKMRDKCLLLVLDNFEQVAPAAVQVAALLPSCPKLKILATSRMALHVRAEQEFAVPPLALPDLKHLPNLVALSQYESVALFIQQAQAVKPDFTVTNATAPAIAEICVRLDGLPLAIELAAARSKLLPPEALLTRLGQRLAVLTGGARDVPARQQTLRATIAWSYHLLDAQEQQLFRELTIFVGGCSLEAIAAVCTIPRAGDEQMMIDQLASLIDKSLAQQTEQEGREPRFLLLETIREYGLEALTASGELEATRQAHAEYYCHQADQAEPELVGPQTAAWLERLDREQGNLRAAMQWVLEPAQTGRDPERALRLGHALREFWGVRGLYREGWAFLEQALAANLDAATVVRARVLITAADFTSELGDAERGEALCQESLSLSRALGDTRGIIDSLTYLESISGWNGGHRGQSLPLVEEGLTLARDLGDPEIIAWGLSTLGDRLYAVGKYTEGLARYAEGLSLFRGLGNKRGIATCLMGLARGLVSVHGDPTTIHNHLDESRAFYVESGDKLGIALHDFFSGTTALAEGDTATARDFAEQSLARFQEMGSRWRAICALWLLGKIAAREGNHAVARTHYEEGLKEASAFKDHWIKFFCLEGLAETVTAQGAEAWAALLWGTAEVESELCGVPLSPDQQRDHEAAIAAARLQLGDAAFDAAWAEGRSLTPEQALARRS
jgi:predicted ATPase/class 3 adenylate cyclase